MCICPTIRSGYTIRRGHCTRSCSTRRTRPEPGRRRRLARSGPSSSHCLFDKARHWGSRRTSHQRTAVLARTGHRWCRGRSICCWPDRRCRADRPWMSAQSSCHCRRRSGFRSRCPLRRYRPCTPWPWRSAWYSRPGRRRFRPVRRSPSYWQDIPNVTPLPEQRNRYPSCRPHCRLCRSPCRPCRNRCCPRRIRSGTPDRSYRNRPVPWTG